MDIQYFDTLPSTNAYCKLLDLKETEEFTVICAKKQTAGVGQRGNVWESEADKNLTFSLILHPTFLETAQQYILTKVLSLGITDWLQETLPQMPIAIKWPNDIYVGERKIGGILVENHVGKHIESAICGIGLNINQTEFSQWIPNPVSLAQITGHPHPLEASLTAVIEAIAKRYETVRKGRIATIDADYWGKILFREEERRYLYHGQEITAKIVGINPFGHLQLETATGTHLSCELKELQYIIYSSALPFSQ